MRHPEVVIQGLPFDVAQTFLNYVGQDVRDGKAFPAGTVTEDLTGPGSPVVFIGGEDDSGLTAVRQVYGTVQARRCNWFGRTRRDAGHGLRDMRIPRQPSRCWDRRSSAGPEADA